MLADNFAERAERGMTTGERWLSDVCSFFICCFDSPGVWAEGIFLLTSLLTPFPRGWQNLASWILHSDGEMKAEELKGWHEMYLALLSIRSFSFNLYMEKRAQNPYFPLRLHFSKILSQVWRERLPLNTAKMSGWKMKQLSQSFISCVSMPNIWTFGTSGQLTIVWFSSRNAGRWSPNQRRGEAADEFVITVCWSPTSEVLWLDLNVVSLKRNSRAI